MKRWWWPRTSNRTTKGSLGRAAKRTRRCISTNNGSKSRSSFAGCARASAVPMWQMRSPASPTPDRFGKLVFGTVWTVCPDDRTDEDESLEPFGKDGAGHARYAPADVVEAAAATQDFPY